MGGITASAWVWMLATVYSFSIEFHMVSVLMLLQTYPLIYSKKGTSPLYLINIASR
jgi:hypothetical protein